jgi:hypothetical protein
MGTDVGVADMLVSVGSCCFHKVPAFQFLWLAQQLCLVSDSSG